jgi:capsular exopolysaccharide synthesis family protein
MSRIYDAHQKADLERKSAQELAAAEMAEPFGAFGEEDLPPAEAGFALENIALRPWNPSMVSLPTLADRGESIEQFRGLRSQLQKFRDQGPLKTILVSSGMPAEGKTFVASNLAMSLARNQNNSVLLIDADLRRPSLHTILGTDKKPGLTEYLAGTAELNEVMQRNQNPTVMEAGLVRSIPNLTLIPGGAGGDNASELVANDRLERLVAKLAPSFDWILIDSPPVLAFADAIDLARAADAVLLVARGASTPFDVAQRAQASFSNARILGFVLNAVKDAPRNGSYYYYYGRPEADRGFQWRKDKRRQG